MDIVVPFCDLRRSLSPIRSRIELAIRDVLSSGWFLRGTQVAAFEEEWATYCGQSYCVSCNSGTDALTLAALAAGITKTDVQSNTLPLTAVGLTRAGCKVVAHEVDADGRLKEVTSNSVPVLLYGRIPNQCENKAMLFDAAHAHGWRPPKHSIACWSFYPTKTLGAVGDGGAITTNDESLAAEMRELSGRDDQFHDGRQITSRMDELQAAVLRVKLQYLNQWLAERKQIAALYKQALPPSVTIVGDPSKDLQHLFVVRSNVRDQLASYLQENGIQTRVHFPIPLHRQNAPWQNSTKQFPNADEWCRSVLSLPCFPGLSDTEVLKICELVSNFRKQKCCPD